MMFVLCWLLTVYWLALILYVVFSWVRRPPDPLRPLIRAVDAVVDPLAAPLRRVIPPLRFGTMGLDVSILVLFVGVILIQAILC